MKPKYIVASAMVASFALGAVAVQSLQAQSKPPGHAIIEVNVTDKDGYMKEFLPLAVKTIEGAGGRYIVRGGKTLTLQGTAPASRSRGASVDTLEKAQAWWESPARKDAQSIGDKYATTRAFAVEGASP